VGSSPDDTSPYGIVDLAGNVSEWTRSAATSNRNVRGLRVTVGASWSTAPELRFLQEVSNRNTHPDQYLDFSLGLRCLLDPPG
jgi:formylglycine-generating enzyme required for sulfatase activity